MNFYRVIYKLPGKSLSQYKVSVKMPYRLAKRYYDKLKKNNNKPEIVKVV